MELPGKQLCFYSGKVRRIGVIERGMALKATFNNNSVISLQSVLLVEETRVQGKNKRPSESH